MANSTRQNSLCKTEARLEALEKAINDISEKFKKLETVVLGLEDIRNVVATRDVVNLQVENKLSSLELQMGELASKV